MLVITKSCGRIFPIKEIIIITNDNPSIGVLDLEVTNDKNHRISGSNQPAPESGLFVIIKKIKIKIFRNSEVLGEDLPDLLQSDEENDSKGALPRNGGNKPFVKRHGPLGSDRLQSAVQRAGVRRRLPRLHLHVHHSRLHHIDGIRRHRCHDPRPEAGAHVGTHSVFHHPASDNRFLGLIVGRELRRRDDHGAVDGHGRAAP